MGLFKLIATLVAGLLWTAWAYFVLREKNINPFRDVLDGFSRLRWLNKVAILFIVVQLTMFGGAKHGGTNDVDGVNGTNDVQQVSGTNDVGEVDWTNGVDGVSWTNDFGGADGGASGTSGNGQPMLMMLGGVPPSLSDDEQECGDAVPVQSYRLDGVTTNANISYEMPSDAMVRGCWHLRGAYEDVFRLDLGTFRFPLGNELLSSLWVYTWGKVRPHLAAVSNDVRVTGVPMSAIPGVSRLWSRAGTNSFLLTWEDFVIGRHSVSNDLPPELVSAQLELYPTGDFIARSNEVEWVYHRVVPPNPITPVNPEDPLHPGVSIHPYGPAQDLSVIEEANAYCWVDIVVERADSWVRFEGDGFSNLSDPSFAAKAGETNRVVILIGKTYQVSCDMPFRVIDKSSEAIDEWWEDSQTLWLNWPVDIWAQGDDEMPLLLLGAGFGSSRPHGFTMFVSPSGLGGNFAWTNSCCSVSGSGYYFSYNCNDDCHCGGCAASGYYSYEGYRVPSWGGSCGCSYEDDPDDPHEDDPDEPPPPAGVSIYFSKATVIFEDEYHPTSNSTVLARSTTTELCCSVYAGENGGSVLITASGIDNRLESVGGSQTFPVYRQLEPRETFAFTNVYKAVAQSSGAEDIVVTGTFIENETGESFDDEDKATAIRVKFEPVVLAPENRSQERHRYGICEEVNCEQLPAAPQIDWHVTAGTMQEGGRKYICPIRAIGNPLKARCGGAEYTPIISVVEPSIVQVRNPSYEDFDAPIGEAGSLVMRLPLYIGPFDVSFGRIAVEEVPHEDLSNDTGEHIGYFGRQDMALWWYHTRGNGAGIWREVMSEDNRMGEGCYDQAGITETLSRVTEDGMFIDDPSYHWIYGLIVMNNPFGWNTANTSGNTLPVEMFATGTQNRLELFSDGTFVVEKLGNVAIRYVNGEVYLNGALKNGSN